MASRNFIQAAFLSSNVERSGGLKFIWLCPPLTFLKLEKKNWRENERIRRVKFGQYKFNLSINYVYIKTSIRLC